MYPWSRKQALENFGRGVRLILRAMVYGNDVPGFEARHYPVWACLPPRGRPAGKKMYGTGI